MAKILFSLSGVGEEEAEDVRQLLEDSDISFYETGAGFWGTGVAAIWLQDETQLPVARELVDNYQQSRSESVRQAWLQEKLSGEQRGWREKFIEQPLKTIIFIFLAGLVAYLSIIPFVDMMAH